MVILLLLIPATSGLDVKNIELEVRKFFFLNSENFTINISHCNEKTEKFLFFFLFFNEISQYKDF